MSPTLLLFLIFTYIHILVCYEDMRIPCMYNEGGEDQPSGCTKRIKPCRELTETEKQTITVIDTDSNTNCKTTADGRRLRDTISTNKHNTYYVKFDDFHGKCWGIVMEGGECWGRNPANGKIYDCMGRCGPGCGTGLKCSNWARDCLKHDVCSWFYGSQSGMRHIHCGDEFMHAFNDWASCCTQRICRALCSGKQSTCPWDDSDAYPNSDETQSVKSSEDGWNSWANPWVDTDYKYMDKTSKTQASKTQSLLPVDEWKEIETIVMVLLCIITSIVFVCGFIGIIAGYTISRVCMNKSII